MVCRAGTHACVHASVQGPLLAQASLVDLSDAATSHRTLLKLLKQVLRTVSKGPPDGVVSEAQRVLRGMAVQPFQLFAQIRGKDISAGGSPLTPLDEGRTQGL